MHTRPNDDLGRLRANDYGPSPEAPNQHLAPAGTSITVTILVFMAAIALVRFVMPGLVEQVHYSRERGRQRAGYEVAVEFLANDPLAQLSTASQLVAKKIAPSVVHIDATRLDNSLLSPDQGEPKLGQGAGVVMNVRGDIVTNYHVVHGASNIAVTLADDRTFIAEVIGVDPEADIAVIRIDAKNLVAAEWADSEQLREGAMVWAAGSPFGLSKTVTFGILSAKTRRTYDHGVVKELLQSDVAVSGGNSGGPLVDSRGKVVGINTAIMGPTYQGVSFAIPSNKACEVYEALRHGEQNHQGWLGVQLAPAPKRDSVDVAPSGAMIAGLITEHSPAHKAGIKAGDIIMRWDGRDVGSPRDLTNLVVQTEVDRDVEVEIFRQGSLKKLLVSVGIRPLQF